MIEAKERYIPPKKRPAIQYLYFRGIDIMKKKSLFSFLTASACMFSMLTTPAQLIQSLPASASTTVANPFIYSDVPDDDIIRVDDTYYMVSTTMFFSPGAPIMKSKDLFSWEMCGYVFDKYADGDVQNLANGKHDYSHGQWATSLRYHDGYYYVFFGSYGSNKSYIYKTQDIESGNWTRSELNGMYHDFRRRRQKLSGVRRRRRNQD